MLQTKYSAAFRSVISDERYLRNLDWGKPRRGHPEGTVRQHIAELESNLERLEPRCSETDYWRLKLLIHTHDSFKAESQPGVAIADPSSHASLAKAFLAEFCDDGDLLAMVQFHDELYALWRKFDRWGTVDEQRLTTLVETVIDWNLFLAFHIIDGCTKGKSRKPLVWLFQQLEGKVVSTFTAADIIG